MTESGAQPLSLENISVSYGKGAPVLRDVSFSVERGETFGLIGVNGAGKTTLMKVLLGLRRAGSGKVAVFGGKPAKTPGKANGDKGGVAYLPERFDPPPFLSGEEFLQYSLRLYGMTYNSDRAVDMAAQLALLPQDLKKRIATYSKGMRQKLGLLAVLLTECGLLLLDEPMSGLDPMARLQVKEALMQARWDGKTIFLSSHILFDMEELCGRVAVLHDGRILFTGMPEELVAKQKADNLERAFLQIVQQDRDTGQELRAA